MSKYRVSIKSPTIVASRFVRPRRSADGRLLLNTFLHLLDKFPAPRGYTHGRLFAAVNRLENRFVHYSISPGKNVKSGNERFSEILQRRVVAAP